MNSRYCPGWKRKASAEGSCRVISITSGARGSRDSTRTGILRTTISSAMRISRASITRSEAGCAWHSRVCPRARSAASRMRAGAGPASYSPETTRPSQVEQVPSRQLQGTTRLAARAASRTVCPGSTVNSRLAGSTVTLKLMLWIPSACCRSPILVPRSRPEAGLLDLDVQQASLAGPAAGILGQFLGRQDQFRIARPVDAPQHHARGTHAGPLGNAVVLVQPHQDGAASAAGQGLELVERHHQELALAAEQGNGRVV